MKTIEARKDYWVYVSDDEGIGLECKKCTWKVDLLKLDELEDIAQELEHHRDKCFEWSNHEARTDES